MRIVALVEPYGNDTENAEDTTSVFSVFSVPNNFSIILMILRNLTDITNEEQSK